MKSRNKTLSLILGMAFGLTVAGGTAVMAQENIATLRGDTKLNKEGKAPLMRPVKNADVKQGRNYPEQPPLIPHKIDGYQINLNSNKCLSCHARARTEESQAPMVSITHFMDRDNQFRASVTPRRYFCTQCHVTQQDVKPLVDNTFVDIDKVLEKAAGKKK